MGGGINHAQGRVLAVGRALVFTLLKMGTHGKILM